MVIADKAVVRALSEERPSAVVLLYIPVVQCTVQSRREVQKKSSTNKDVIGSCASKRWHSFVLAAPHHCLLIHYWNDLEWFLRHFSF